MPGISGAKKLYLAQSVGELNETVKKKVANISDIKRYSKSAKTAYQEADRCYLDADEERAYLYYMIFLELYALSKDKGKDGKPVKDIKELTQTFDKKNLLRAVVKAEDLQSSLSKRYDALSETVEPVENNFQENQAEIESNAKEEVNDVEVKETLSEVFKKESSGTISCSELYKLLLDSSITLIILDCRSESVFNGIHIKHEYCTNIPEEVLKPGITSSKIEKSLPPSAKNIWQIRDKVDFVVLVDTNSSSSSVKLGSPLHSLREALCKWDLSKVLKSEPLILEGGFDNWFLHYPTITNGSLSASDIGDMVSASNSVNFEELEICDYPDLNEAFLTSPEEKESDVIQMNNGWMNNSKFFLKPQVNRHTKPKSVSEKENQEDATSYKNLMKLPGDKKNQDDQSSYKNHMKLHGEKKNQEDTSSYNNLMKLPGEKKNKEDTSSYKNLMKLPGEKKNQEDTSSYKNLMKLPGEFEKKINIKKTSKQELPVIDRSSKPSHLINHKQNELINHVQNHLEDVSSKNNDGISKDMLRLRTELKAEEDMRFALQEKEESLLSKIRTLQEDNINMKKELDDIHKQEKSLKVQDKDEEKIKMQKDIERLREEKKKKELEKVESKPKKEEVENSETVQTLKKSDGPNIINNADVKLSKNLSRSHSSPNIVQMLEQEENKNAFRGHPHFDRSLKPSQRPNFYATINGTLELTNSQLRNLNPVYGSQEYAITGLKNLGNTCFMNSIIQCLSNTIPLAAYLVSGNYKHSINRKSKQGTGGEVAEEFAVVLKALWIGHYRSISPREFKNTVSRYLSVCVGHDQQDSHEFLVILMEKLHGDLNQQENQTLNQPKIENLPDHIAEEKFWNHHLSLNQSVIVEFFEGLLRSTLRCLHCNTTSSSYEVFSCLSLPIPSNRCSLKDCLSLFLKEERMAGEGAWDCPHCKQKQEAEKKMVICRLPKVLIIQLKRFSYEGLWRRKLQTHVDVPTSEMDMKPFVNASNQKSLYHLYGVVNHFGTLEGGHYTAFCKNSGYDKWYKYDDQDVSGPISQKEVNTSAAYILFYSSMDFHSFL